MFRSRFLLKLFLGFGAVIALATVLILTFASRLIETDALAAIETGLRSQALLIGDLAAPWFADSSGADATVRTQELGERLGVRITVIAADGRVLADSEREPGALDNHGTRPEIQDARERGWGRAIRYSDTLRTRMMYCSRAVRDPASDRLAGYVRVALPLTAVDARMGELKRGVILGAAGAALAALLLGAWMARRITLPLREMTEAVRAMAAGDYDRRAIPAGSDEVGELARAFDGMADQLRDRLDRLTQEHDKLQAILAGMVEGVIAVNREERVLHMNAVAGRFLGVDPAAALGKPFWEVARVPDIAEALADCFKGELELGREIRRMGPEGERILQIFGSPLPGESGPAGALLVLHEITALRRLETIRRDFVANVSHELKTPLTAIRALVETVEDDAAMSPETRQRFLGKIRKQAERLTAQVADLMALSRLESGETDEGREALDLREVAQAACGALATSAETRGIQLSMELPERPAIVMGERESLEQALRNLLDNAVKYTPAGGRVSLRLWQESGQVMAEVADTGIGIEPQHLNRIFERFYRVDKARSRELGGTGLGLAIVKHAAQAHGGDIEVTSQVGLGSRFRLRLPAAEANGASKLHIPFTRSS
jgi:two-component system phosphate regulon sensor histidine kinase PhoR